MEVQSRGRSLTCFINIDAVKHIYEEKLIYLIFSENPIGINYITENFFIANERQVYLYIGRYRRL